MRRGRRKSREIKRKSRSRTPLLLHLLLHYIINIILLWHHKNKPRQKNWCLTVPPRFPFIGWLSTERFVTFSLEEEQDDQMIISTSAYRWENPPFNMKKQLQFHSNEFLKIILSHSPSNNKCELELMSLSLTITTTSTLWTSEFSGHNNFPECEFISKPCMCWTPSCVHRQSTKTHLLRVHAKLNRRRPLTFWLSSREWQERAAQSETEHLRIFTGSSGFP